MELQLAFRKKQVNVRIPDKNMAGVLYPNTPATGQSVPEIIRRALENPIGAPRLRDIVQKGEKIAIITSDITRPMPSREVLPDLLEELYSAGIKDGDIEIVFGLGSHRGHTGDEMRYLVGDSVYGRIRCTDSNAGRYMRVGYTPDNKTPVDVFENVVNADRRVCLGNIEFHYFAGYSGGGKAIMPAVCSRASIQANHALMVEDTSCAGELARNRLRRDIEQAADMVGIDFILNVVLDENKNVVGAVCGDHVEAHRAGAKLLDGIYKIPISRRADIVLVSAGGYPKDINLYQAQKALDNAKHAVKDGGIIILVASCGEGLGESVFERWITTAETSGQMIADIRRNFELGGHKAAALAMILERARIFLVSELEPGFVKNIFLEPYPDTQSALDSALELLGRDSTVLVMPYGGSTLPACAIRE